MGFSNGDECGRAARTGIFLPRKTVAITATAKPSVTASSDSPSSGTANSMPRKGCSSWTWLTRTVPPSARPRYQAKKPIHIENTADVGEAPPRGCLQRLLRTGQQCRRQRQRQRNAPAPSRSRARRACAARAARPSRSPRRRRPSPPAAAHRRAGSPGRLAPERSTAKATTSALPSAAQAQKPAEGRCRCSQAPTAAVASGSTPMITLACTASTWRMAIEDSSGKPNTTPPEVMASGSQSSRARQRRAGCQQEDGGQQRGDGGAAQSDEDARHLRRLGRAHRQPRHRQRQREDGHARQARAKGLCFPAAVHTVSIQAAVATSTSARARLNHSRREPCDSHCRSIEPSHA